MTNENRRQRQQKRTHKGWSYQTKTLTKLDMCKDVENNTKNFSREHRDKKKFKL